MLTKGEPRRLERVLNAAVLVLICVPAIYEVFRLAT
jgi:hypothetical protein